MERRNVVTVGVRRTGWAALDRDPQQDTVEFICPHCGARDKKMPGASARSIISQWLFAGFAGRNDAMPFVQTVAASCSDRDVARSG